MSLPSVLEKILSTKRAEVTAGRESAPEPELLASCADLPPPRGFIERMEAVAQGGPAVIGEIKKASPSRGLIRPDFDPAAIAKSYEAGGAACLSVLTDEPYFQGKSEYLAQARDACSLPVLRKDFIIDPWQIAESRYLGADAILLIVAALEPSKLSDLHARATGLGLDVLVEVHNEQELETALGLENALLGVNNRDLHTFETDLGTSERLHKMVPDDRLLVCESGIAEKRDVQRMLDSGINAFLVGEAFMREADPGKALEQLFN